MPKLATGAALPKKPTGVTLDLATPSPQQLHPVMHAYAYAYALWCFTQANTCLADNAGDQQQIGGFYLGLQTTTTTTTTATTNATAAHALLHALWTNMVTGNPGHSPIPPDDVMNNIVPYRVFCESQSSALIM